MLFTFTPTSALNALVLAGLLASAATGVAAQTAPTASTVSSQPSAAGERRMGGHDPAHMQARMAKRQAEMKTKLAITPAQEGAWSYYTSAMQPPARWGARPSAEQRAELDKLSTPERVDKMRSLRAERMKAMGTAMDQRGEATKALYAALTPAQQKVMDAELKNHHAQGDKGHHEHSSYGMKKG
ncbi:MAG: Spy/CpxP family protein refolding chaperone [Chitinophagaceae bacterium]|nr:Spy/CpxP family protein refolding chaperone [Polaromonas sp.]